MINLSSMINPSPGDVELNLDHLDKYSDVNRLIIIGNGFDLAHGLKTSFKDFIEDYFFQIYSTLWDYNKYNDDLIEIATFGNLNYLRDPSFGYTPEDTFKELKKLMKNNQGIVVRRMSKFLKIIINEINTKNWVDIELIFFKMLKESSRDGQIIKRLNLEMGHLKMLLKDYLNREVEKHKVKSISKIHSQFIEGFLRKDAQPITIQEDKRIKSFCILNFNYTNTPQIYLDELENDINTQHIQIHGSLKGDDNYSQGLVFGFGDELDEEYLKFENMENDDLFEHIKSFKYLQFQNYRNLLDFIESNPFQVQVYGHSLGLSDRTLLNTIFENENCISIKMFYHKWKNGDDFEKKSYAISRHFRSKSALRSKVVNKEYCEAMGQLQ